MQNEFSVRFEYKHCTDEEFIDFFRNDLSVAEKHVIILSPFLSQKRSLSYYPVFQTICSQKIEIEVYTKPKNEQPDILKNRFDIIQTRLETIGVHLYFRPGMHEKIGIIDDKVLWHGSLNILSHNNTKESMLRFVSSDLVKEMKQDLGLKGKNFVTQTAHSKVADDELHWPSLEIRECPQCKGDMRYYKASAFWICNNSPQCSGVLSDTMETTEAGINSNYSIELVNICCPLCGASMKAKKGLFSRITCSSEKCDFTFDQRLSAGLMRILRKKDR